MIDPLHQFMITPLIKLSLAGYDISFTNSALFMVLATLSSIGLLMVATRRLRLVPSRLQFIGESLYRFIHQMILDNVGEKGLPYLPYIMSLFLFILMGNCLGMVPYGFTFTSHIIVTFSLAIFVITVVTVLGFVYHGFHFLNLFCPRGMPIYIIPLLIPVEIMSYLTRPVSLSIRLFANMMAGHAMLKIFAGFVVIFAGTTLFPVAILPFVVNLGVMGFEFLVAFLQAYVFTVLTCLYLSDALHLH
jgi:F-type H+-transporting ATPase subunit a